VKKILLINTGGTFNKIYNPLNGELQIDKNATALKEISQKWLYEYEVVNIISKDSLYIDNQDRLLLLATINLSRHDDILIIHGTDTMDITAKYLADAKLNRRIVLTGAMVPYAIDPIEATANFASALGYLQTLTHEGVYIAMNGVMGSYTEVVKDREAGRFICL